MRKDRKVNSFLVRVHKSHTEKKQEFIPYKKHKPTQEELDEHLEMIRKKKIR